MRSCEPAFRRKVTQNEDSSHPITIQGKGLTDEITSQGIVT